ncbi:hypothetical protein AAUPMC_05827 [Pasteurella multocida subsp. multocida str. Anand1_cattle]|nr:hypothetical protein AAUPMC_05827 [Pasteurella multocida subsp. multocida str. Anand1_cattle]
MRLIYINVKAILTMINGITIMPITINVFALLGWVAAELATGLDSWWHADVVHAHDWHAGLASAYLF